MQVGSSNYNYCTAHHANSAEIKFRTTTTNGSGGDVIKTSPNDVMSGTNSPIRWMKYGWAGATENTNTHTDAHVTSTHTERMYTVGWGLPLVHVRMCI